MSKQKYDAVIVLSAGDVETTNKRIEKARELYNQGLTSFLSFNGFNSKERHDEGFEGDWQGDFRLKPYIKFIGSLPKKVYEIVYAHTTEQNVYEAKKSARERNLNKLAIISSVTHINNEFLNIKNGGRVPRLFRKFFPNFSRLEFIAVQEPSGKSRKKRAIRELLSNFLTYLELYNLPRGDGPETDKKIFQIADHRKLNYYNKLSNLMNKISK